MIEHEIEAKVAHKEAYDREEGKRLLDDLSDSIGGRLVSEIPDARFHLLLLMMKNDNQAKMLYSVGKPFTSLDPSLYLTTSWANRGYKVVVYLAIYPERK